ncbi:dachshund protein [Caerostris extrusa]|uniref:Dachshund protein n=1 Tax=Caerostris extrusa TaxID=172846 RepID=A0AAV4XJA8_CAEEX|nr:dachshund protein [Caerostris extrusa]
MHPRHLLLNLLPPPISDRVSNFYLRVRCLRFHVIFFHPLPYLDMSKKNEIINGPGRPPKRATMVGMNPNGTNHSMLLKKSRMDGEYPGYENGHIGGGEKCFYGDRVDKSHLLANGYSHHVAAAQAAVVAATAGAPPHLNPLPFMALNHAAAAAAHHNSMMSGTLPLAASSSHGHLNSSSSSGRGPESSSVIKERNSHTSDVINSTR